ncbi:MAG: hypothetical protein WHT08_04070 [Bryobacteraceae bacterium]
MDTRRKIVSDPRGWKPPEGALEVAGPFDPLLAAHARQLEQLKGSAPALVAYVTDPPDPLLPAQARAELVAALRCVDLVVLGAVPPEGALDLTADHLRWRSELEARVAEAARAESGSPA